MLRQTICQQRTRRNSRAHLEAGEVVQVGEGRLSEVGGPGEIQGVDGMIPRDE